MCAYNVILHRAAVIVVNDVAQSKLSADAGAALSNRIPQLVARCARHHRHRHPLARSCVRVGSPRDDLGLCSLNADGICASDASKGSNVCARRVITDAGCPRHDGRSLINRMCSPGISVPLTPSSTPLPHPTPPTTRSARSRDSRSNKRSCASRLARFFARECKRARGLSIVRARTKNVSSR